jgi:hypothetical protein
MNRKFLTLAIAALVGFTGCRKSWLEEYTEDPTRPIESSPAVLLPSAQMFFGLSQGDVLPRMSCLFMQQMTGTDRQSLAHQRYSQIGEADFDQTWGANGYSGGLYDLKLIIDATEGTSPHYSGVAKIMTAAYLGLFSDVWGDIPYSEAMQDIGNLNPKYDSQEQIYNTIFTLLDQGIVEVGTATSALSPTSSSDLIYKGDLSKWTKFAYSLKARYLLHLSKKSSFNVDGVLAAANQGFTSNDDNAQIIFPGTPNSNPWYQFNSQRLGYISQFGTMYDDLMIPNNDPRVDLYRSSDSLTMPFYGSQTSPLPIMTYHELQFIIAEATQRKGGAAATELESAVEANMEYLGVEAADITTYVAALPANPSLEEIMVEKYIAMFSHIESWTDWRRTGFPNLTPEAGANLPEIPRRLPYPQNEMLYNSNFINLSGNDAFLKRHWWDE